MKKFIVAVSIWIILTSFAIAITAAFKLPIWGAMIIGIMAGIGTLPIYYWVADRWFE
jgi:hypothetical protein